MVRSTYCSLGPEHPKLGYATGPGGYGPDHCVSGSGAPCDAPFSSFLHDLASGLVPFFVLELCLIFWVFYHASNGLLEVLIIKSPGLLRLSHVCTLLDYKTNTCEFISPIWLCRSSNTKIQTKWA